jgi:Flp pilus assembly protein TadG
VSKIVDIDFVAPNALSFKRMTAYGLILMLIAFALGIYCIQHINASQTALTIAQNRLDAIAPEVKTTTVETVVETASEAEIKYAREVVAQLSTPWNPLMSTLEQSNMSNIALLSIEPNRKKQQIILTGQAKNIQSTLSYIKQLERIETLSQVYLLKHSIDQTDPFKPVGFTILAQWKI